MNVTTVLPLFVGLALTLHAPLASGQYTPRPGGSEAERQTVAEHRTAGTPAGLGLAFVTYLNGESLLRSTGDEEWVALSSNLSLRIGDRIWAQDGAKIEIRFPSGATAWVNYQSELDIIRLERGGRGETIQVALVAGEAAFDVKGFSRSGSVFQVDLPNTSIRTSRAARFRVNTLPDGTAQIGVVSGSLVLETPDGLTDVRGGQMAEVQPDQRVTMDFLPAGDEWDAWVGSRAEIYTRPAASARYLPADLSSYAHEFDTSGRWVRDPTYGSIWVPTVAKGWSPYFNGRWVWQANDYVWLSFDPWYAPFHFGRWSWGISTGWFWIVPQGRAYWSPGYVGWSIVGDDVSWVPLGQNEVYYGYGNFGSQSVNVAEKTTYNVTNVYVNSSVPNGVVVVQKDDFLHGKIVNERIAPARNPFAKRGASGLLVIGRPPVQEIRPIRETRQPRPEVEIKRVSLPPVRLEKESITIKNRVVAPTMEKSVFKPGNKPPPLKNIVRAKELEQWIAPQKVKAPQTVVAPSQAEHPNKSAAPGKPATPAVQARKVRPPAGKLLFKRIVEPRGGTSEAPAPQVVPEEQPQGENEKQPAGADSKKGGGQGNEKGGGKNK